MRIVARMFCALFVLAAVLQLNDPDPVLWTLAYLLAAMLSLGAALGRSWMLANVAASILFGVWFLLLAPSLVEAESAAFRSFKMSEARHEEPREAVGLALAACWCAALAWQSRTKSRT
jgi:hypothetical protein